LKAKYVIPVANGTDALQIALMALGIGIGDEVITPDFCFIAPAEAVAMVGATPVLADVQEADFNIDASKIERLITNRTKAIIAVHLFGQCANMDAIIKIAKKYNLYIIEDAAQAIGAKYHGETVNGFAGTLCDIGCTSFFPSKNLGCYGDGGALITNDNKIAGRLKMLANHGSKIKYEHEIIGFNSRLDTIQAAVLNVKLKYLNQFNQNRKLVADHYDAIFANIKEIEIPKRKKFSSHIFHQYTIKLEENENQNLKQWLKENGISSTIYYPVPIHMQKAFKNFMVFDDENPVSSSLCKKVLSLPMHPDLTMEQIDYITDKIQEFFTK